MIECKQGRIYGQEGWAEAVMQVDGRSMLVDGAVMGLGRSHKAQKSVLLPIPHHPNFFVTNGSASYRVA